MLLRGISVMATRTICNGETAVRFRNTPSPYSIMVVYRCGKAVVLVRFQMGARYCYPQWWRYSVGNRVSVMTWRFEFFQYRGFIV